MSALHAAVVSGASTGIGLATVEALARSGCIAFAGVRSEADASRLRELHANVRPVLLDVTDTASIAAAVDEVRAAGVAIGGIVSNAGIALGGPLELLPIEVVRRQFEVNVFGALAFAQAFLPLLPHEGGRLVFVGSIAGRLATPYVGPYSGSKFALRAFADALRVELAPAGIAVALIEPGSVKTPIWAKGRASRDALLGLLAAGSRPHYRQALEGVMAQTEAEERNGLPVEVVATAILDALTAAKPRAQYLLGGPAKMGGMLALLPAGLRDRAIRAAMRLP